MIDVPEAQDPQLQRGRVALDKRADAKHPTWCSLAHCFVTDEGCGSTIRPPVRWEDHEAEVRFESRLLDPADDEHLSLELPLQCLRFRGNGFSWFVPVAAVRRLRDQLTALRGELAVQIDGHINVIKGPGDL